MSRYAKFFAILKEANKAGMNKEYREVISEFTDGRTSRLSELSDIELMQLQENLSSLNHSGTKKPAQPESVEDNMRKAIIAQFLSIGRTTQDAIAWAEKNGVFGVKRQFNDYTKRELYQLIRNAEKVKRDHIIAVSKRLKNSN